MRANWNKMWLFVSGDVKENAVLKMNLPVEEFKNNPKTFVLSVSLRSISKLESVQQCSWNSLRTAIVGGNRAFV